MISTTTSVRGYRKSLAKQKKKTTRAQECQGRLLGRVKPAVPTEADPYQEALGATFFGRRALASGVTPPFHHPHYLTGRIPERGRKIAKIALGQETNRDHARRQ